MKFSRFPFQFLFIFFFFLFCWEIISFIYFPLPLSIRVYEWNAIDKHFLWAKNMNKFYFMGYFESVRFVDDLQRMNEEKNYWECWLGTRASCHCNLQMYFMVQQVILFLKNFPSNKNWCCERRKKREKKKKKIIKRIYIFMTLSRTHPCGFLFPSLFFFRINNYPFCRSFVHSL